MQQNTSFGGIDPLTPVSSVSAGVLRAQSILFVCLSVTLLVAFIAVLAKQWVRYYTRATTWGNIVDRGKTHQAKFVGLQKWGLSLVIDSLSVMLQFALLLFGVALTIYLWELDFPTAEAVLGITSIGFAFYTCITLLATIFRDCPFQTPLSCLLPSVLPWMKKFPALTRAWPRRKATSLLLWIARAFRIFTGGENASDHAEEDPYNHYSFCFSNPIFWRKDPLFTSPIPKDIAASAGFWLLENSTDSLAVSAVAAVFSELQWPSENRSTTTALVRLRDAYVECFRAPEFKGSARLQALESAAAYYVLYHSRLVWSTSNRLPFDLDELPPDLLLHLHSERWGLDDVFEHLLHIRDRSGSVTSAQFLSYIAPYWFCGDSNSSVKFRPSRLQTLYELITVLEDNQALNPTTLTNCFLCAGAAMDFPLHPEDLVRVDKRYVPFPYTSTMTLIADSDYMVPTFKLVIEHIHGIILARGRRRRHTTTALEIIYTLVQKVPFPLVDTLWINGLLESASRGNMGDEAFALFLRLSARREEDDTGEDHVHIQVQETDLQPPSGTATQEITTPEYSLFIKILRNVRTCSEQGRGWWDEAVYGGLIAMGDIPRLGSCLPDSEALETLFKAMDRSQPFRVRKAAYDVVLATRDGWVGSVELRQTLQNLDFPRQLYRIANETGRSDYQRSFLDMIEILLDDGHWHSYLREAMDIWLPLRHEAPHQILRIIARIGNLPVQGYENNSNPPSLDRFLAKLVEDEWKRVPGRPVTDLTADRLKPLAEITKQFKERLFTEPDRRAVLVAVEPVIPTLGKHRVNGQEVPGEDVRRIINDLLEVLREPVRSDQRSIHSGD